MTKPMGDVSDYLSLGYKGSLGQKISDETLVPKTDPEDHWFVVALTTDKKKTKKHPQGFGWCVCLSLIM